MADDIGGFEYCAIVKREIYFILWNNELFFLKRAFTGHIPRSTLDGLLCEVALSGEETNALLH